MATANFLLTCCVVAMFLQLCTAKYAVQVSLTLVPIPSAGEAVCPLVGVDNAGGFTVDLRYRVNVTTNNWVILDTLTNGTMNAECSTTILVTFPVACSAS